MTKPTKRNAAQNFTDADLLEQLNGKKGTTLWLGRYTKDDVLHLLEKFGILPAMRKKGFADIVIVIELLEPFVQALRIFNEKADADNQLAEFRLREAAFSPQHFAVGAPLTMLKIEWLMLQNPLAQFSSARPRLPGQRHPGLGLGKPTVQFLVHLAETHHLAGVLNFPEFFHNAYLYLEYFHYCDPRLKGIVLALRRDLVELSLAELSWAVYLGCVIDPNSGQTYEWQADALILPLDEKMKKYFSSAEYEQGVYRTLAEARFVLDRERFEKVLLDH